MGEEIPRGSFVSSLKHMADETGLTVKQVRKCLEKLKNTQNVASKGTNKYTIVSVVNYELYQDEQTRKGQATGHSKGKQRATIKEYKEIKKYYNNTSKKSFDNFSKGVMTTDEMENMEELKEKYGG